MSGLDFTDTDLQRDGLVVGADDRPGCRTLGEAIGFDLRARGLGSEASFFVEDIFTDPLNEAADRASAAYGACGDAARETRLRALIEALVSARTHEGWLALMAGRAESSNSLDLVTDWWFDDPIIDSAARRIGVTMRVNRQRFRLWISFAEVLLLAHTCASQLVRGEISRHQPDRPERSPS